MAEDFLLRSWDLCSVLAGSMKLPISKAKRWAYITIAPQQWDSLYDRNRNSRILEINYDQDEIIALAHEFRLFSLLPAIYVRYLRTWNIVVFFALSVFFC